jgi:hypothetical protein
VSNTELLTLARSVLTRNQSKSWDSAWDSCGTVAKKVSQGLPMAGTVKSELDQSGNLGVPLSQSLGRGTVGQLEKSGTAPGTVVGHPYAAAAFELRNNCPAFVEAHDWQQAIIDSDAFLAIWGVQARTLGWSEHGLFGLHTPPEAPRPTYRRLSRLDCTGLIWLLRGRAVLALTESTATIRTTSGGEIVYRREAQQ